MQRIDIQPYGCRTFHNVSKTVTGERLKIDKHLRDLSNRLNAVSGSGNGNDNDNNNNKITKDDDHYLSLGSEPPRFLYYQHVRAQEW